MHIYSLLHQRNALNKRIGKKLLHTSIEILITAYLTHLR
ncbi:hypothetical protein M6B38_249340 [Iris pallida]|uniref:Uncharacterized protein n=1 Tax=Iris pallida TaxID=29817 RepID=A0AAX6IKC2_IRIPA|nr:hypothetical protein M6B38_249340 [Iris pallida]